jgi:hypothetical protein
MKVVLLVEWDNAKDESRYKKYAEQNREPIPEWWTKLAEETNVKSGEWADNTGHMVNWLEFENIEAYAKLWGNEEWHKFWLSRNPFRDNLSFRLLRPSIPVPE